MKPRIAILTFLMLSSMSTMPALSQWWERGKGFQNDYVYAKAYCYGRGDRLNHEQALLLAYSKDVLPEQTDKEKAKRLKRIASIIINFISGTGNNEEFSGCRKAHSTELASSM